MRDLGTGGYARQVEGDQQSEDPSRTSTTTNNTGTTSTASTRQGTNQGSSSSSTSQGTRQPYVRKVSMFHIGDPPQSFPEEFELSENEEELEIEYFGRIMHVEGTPAEMHFMFGGDQDDDDGVQWMEDELYQWYSESEPEQEDLLVSEEVGNPGALSLFLTQERMCHWRPAG